MNEEGIWIWENEQAEFDEYADFCEKFSLDKENTSVSLRLSADSHYAAYVNGQLAAFGQYADFPHCKVVDTHDISAYCQKGENTLVITVWYHGVPSSTYQTGKAGLYYRLTAEGQVLAVSGTNTLCRKNPYFVPYRKKLITDEQGISFFYDAAGEETVWHGAIGTGYEPLLHERPILPLELWHIVPGKVIGGNGNTHFVLDLGQEEAGFLEFELETTEEQTILIAYGEYLADGKVPRRMGKRDFSVEYGTVIGKNVYINPFRRLGCRYLEVFCEKPIVLSYMGIRPTMYPVNVLPYDPGTPRRKQIYDTAVRTLRLCMHEHYEDCPWREQALYAMDSRNQMLCGYYAFGETRFARASLWLFAQDRREDGFISDCVPAGIGLAIPSFCLHWYQEVLEYTEFSGDATLVQEIWGKLCSVLDAFYSYYDNDMGLIPCFDPQKYWNFYEWSGDFLSGKGRIAGSADLIINCLFLRAIESMTYLAKRANLPFSLRELAPALRKNIRKTFRRPDGLFFTDTEKTHICELGCALAVLTGVADEKDAKVICKMLAGEDVGFATAKIPMDLAHTAPAKDWTPADDETTWIMPASLSMTTFVYDALLQTDREQYADFVLHDIDARYGYMLDQGATTFWETMGGTHAFGGAGSLCHGWSALAVYYYHQLL